MKIRTRLKLLALGIMALLTISIVSAGTIVIDSIVYQLNYRLLDLELRHLHRQVVNWEETLHGSGVADIPHYQQEARREALRQLAEQHSREHGELLVVADQGQHLLGLTDSETPDVTALLMRSQTQPGGFYVQPASSNRPALFVVYRRVAPWNWTLALSVPEARMFPMRRSYLRAVSALALVFFGVAYLALFVVLRKVTDRIETTLHCVRRVGEGDLQARVDDDEAQDEIGSLQAGINEMISLIQQRELESAESRTALLRAQEHLEDRVEARTRQLSAEIAERRKAEALLRDQNAFQVVLAAIRGSAESETLLWRTFLNTLVLSYRLRGAWYGECCEGGLKTSCRAGPVAAPFAEAVVHPDRLPSSAAAEAVRTVAASRRPCCCSGEARDSDSRRDGCLALPVIIDGKLEGILALLAHDERDFPDVRRHQIEFLTLEAGTAISDGRQRRRAEEALIRSERMAAVGTLAGGVAHEFNNINVGVLGFTELALIRDDLDDDLRSSLEHVRDAARRARDITSSLLAFSGMRKSRPEPGNVNEAVRQAAALLAHDLEKERIDLDLRLDPVPDTVMDLSQISQVILNLLINARHALMGRPLRRIAVSTETAIEQEQHWVCVSVSDTGCGIAPEVQRQIFTPFFTTKGEHAERNSPQAAVRGTGLGLSISHGIVTNHHGKITCESEPNVGTTFRIAIPLIAVPSEDDATTTARPADGNAKASQGSLQGRVLVLDDEADTRELLRVLLTRSGCQVYTTADGEEALKHVVATQTDLAIVDLHMALMPGQEFLERMEQLHLPRPPAAIVLTGRVDHESTSELPALVRKVIAKPFDLDTLVNEVSSILQDQNR